MSPKPHRLRHFAEVGVLQVCEGGDQANRLLLDIDEAELAVVVDSDLDWQVFLDRRHQVAEQHREAAIACETDDLSPWLALLQSKRRSHAARHGAVQQTAEGST